MEGERKVEGQNELRMRCRVRENKGGGGDEREQMERWSVREN